MRRDFAAQLLATPRSALNPDPSHRVQLQRMSLQAALEIMSSIHEIKDVPYCLTDSSVDSLRTLDLYIPEALIDSRDDGSQSERQIILVVFVHGGAWRTGDKSNHMNLARRWVSSPSTSTSDKDTFIIVAVPNYRLSPIVKHPVHTDDIHTALQFLLSRPRLFGTNREDLSSFEYSSVWIAGHSAGAHIVSSLVLNAPAPNLTPSNPERDPSTLSQITGVIGIEGIYDVDLLLKNFPTDFYRGFVEDAFGTRSHVDSEGESTETRLPYDDVNIAQYVLPQSGTADKLHWAVVHSREDDLVDLVQAERMYTHVCRLYGGEQDLKEKSLAGGVVLEDKRVRGGHDEVLESEELAEFVHEMIFRGK